MYSKKWSANLFCLMVMALLLNLMSASEGTCTDWQRVALDGGGVAHDVQITRGDNSVVWSACMNSGVYRATYSSGWGNWTEYLPGIGTLGLDAIKVSGTEYVLVGSANFGIFYATSTGGYAFSIENTGRPNGADYPADWKQFTRIHDVAFWWPPSTDPSTPDGEIFALLHTPLTGQNPGIYRWNGSNDFVRIDSEDGINTNTAERYFAYFKRDIGTNNVLYAVLSANDDVGYNGALYKFTGAYTNYFTPVDIVTGSDVLTDVLGFNQYNDGSNIYTYVLAKWLVGGTTEKISVFVGVDISDEETPTFEEIDADYSDFFPEDDPGDWTGLDLRYENGNVVGKPYDDNGTIKHKLWLAAPGWALMYDYPYPSSSPTQISNGLKRWSVRCMAPDDPTHFGAGVDMRLFFGTHQFGMWYLVFTDDTPTYSWSHMSTGYMGAFPRDVRLLGTGSNRDNPCDLICPGYFYGLWSFSNSTNSWSKIAEQSAGFSATGPFQNKGIWRAIKFTDGNYYFGSQPLVNYQNPSSPTSTKMGGLFKTDGSANPTAVTFDAGVDNKDYFVSGLESVGDYLYVSTGLFGPDFPSTSPGSHVVSQFYSPNWTTIFDTDGTTTPANYENLGILGLATDPLYPDTKVYIGLGNAYAYPTPGATSSTWDARVEMI